MKTSRLALGAVAMVVAACGSGNGEGAQTGGVSNTGSTPCVEKVAPNAECPGTWAETIPAGKAFCADRGKSPMFTLARSGGACGPYLRYTTFLFDGGPRNCLYDPKTEKLVGFGFFDGKASWQQRTCNVEQKEAAFPQDCAHITCADAAFGGG
ncbi:MAG: hypothetical protein U0270_03230 [Labilithrix sp.]